MSNGDSARLLSRIDPHSFRAVMSRFPTCATIVATSTSRGPVGCTVNAVLSLSIRPPAVLVSLADGGYTLSRILNSTAFTVNLLCWSQQTLIRRFATGDPHRRFDNVPHGTREGLPLLDGATARLVCNVQQAVPLLDHTLLVGVVTWCDMRGAPPVVAFRRRYGMVTTGALSGARSPMQRDEPSGATEQTVRPIL